MFSPDSRRDGALRDAPVDSNGACLAYPFHLLYRTPHSSSRLSAMCGICVVVHDREPADPALIRAMCDRITHRGPDSEGYHVAGRTALGMRRLSIIDLDTGDQPIFNEDRSLAIVFNGEIYNYRDLRARLVAKGHRFATASDTEVIVHLYEELGAKAVNEL